MRSHPCFWHWVLVHCSIRRHPPRLLCTLLDALISLPSTVIAISSVFFETSIPTYNILPISFINLLSLSLGSWLKGYSVLNQSDAYLANSGFMPKIPFNIIRLIDGGPISATGFVPWFFFGLNPAHLSKASSMRV